MYNLEEQAVIEGLIRQYLLRPSSPHITDRYRTIIEHLYSGSITKPDLMNIKKALNFFLPMYDGKPDVQSCITNALLQTDVLIKEAAA